MTLTVENIILIGSFLLIASIVAKHFFGKIAVPTLVIFLGVGMLAGADGILKIQFDNYKTAQFIGVIALNFILFNGGLSTKWKSIKPVLKEGLILSTVGVLLTAVSLGVFIWWLSNLYLTQGLNIYESLLLGAIVSSTDAAAVFSVLRGKSLKLKHRLQPTLELESGSNDPMAYFLTIALIGFVQNPDQSLWSIIPFFFQQIGIGTICGLGLGWIAKQLINKLRINFDGIYPVLVIGLMYFIFAFTDFVGGNGFLAVYLSGVYLGNQQLVKKQSIFSMFDGMAWLMQIVLFITLGLLVTPSKMLPVMGFGFLLSLFLIFVARPVGVLISLLPFKMPFARRTYISWVGLRGAAPIVFATYPLIAGIDHAEIFFNIVFFISLTSVLLQGSTIPIVAKWLHMALPAKIKPKSPVQTLITDGAHTFLREIIIPPDNPTIGKAIKDLQFPDKSLVAVITRDEQFITPKGTTTIQPLDMLLVLYEKEEVLNEVYPLLGLNREEIEDTED